MRRGTVVKRWGTNSPLSWDGNAVADPLQNLVARTFVSPFQPCSPHVMSCVDQVGRKGGAGPATHPIIHFRRPIGRSKPSFLGTILFFIFVMVDALGLERGLGFWLCCLVLWCRLGLRPLHGDGLFAVVDGGVVTVAARFSFVFVTSH